MVAGGARRSVAAVIAIAAVMTACSSATPRASVRKFSTTVSGKGNDVELIAAAAGGDTPAVRRLLADGANLGAADERGRTALVAASYGSHLDTARVLIEAGADVNRQDNSEQSAYLIATSEIGADTGLELLRLTLDHHADLTSLDSYGGTGLIRAAHRGYQQIVSALIAAHIEIDHVNRLGWTALLEAIILGDGDNAHTDVVRQLVAAGADVNLADSQGVTPLTHARQRGQSVIATILTKMGGRG